MKKSILGIGAVLVGLIAIAIFRASTVFEDVQLPPAKNLAQVELNEEQVVERMARSIRFRTISHDDRSNFDANAFLAFHDYLRGSFPLVHERAELTLINDYSLLFHIAGSDPSLKPVMLMGHMDVVPVDGVTLAEWTHDPFAGKVVDGEIWGRGTLDDKLSVMSFLEAIEALIRDGFEPKRSLYLSFGHDEEVGGQGGAKAVAEHLKEQGIEFEFVVDEGGVVLDGVIDSVDRPVALIGVAEKGYLNLRLRVDAPGGHSSTPPPQSGLGIISRAIVKLEENPFPAELTHINNTFDAYALHAKFTHRLAMGNTWLLGPVITAVLVNDDATAASMRTTTAATMASGSSKSNILPTRAEAVVNFRILPGETAESVRERVIDIINDERVEVIKETSVNPSPVSPTDSMGYELLAQTIRGFDDAILVAPNLLSGGTDARYFHAVSPNVYRFVMIRATTDTLKIVHGIDERIAVEDYLTAIRFYYALIRQATE
ncbi:MAG: M20 family peptidase [Gammaproteobacteria bacterium]